MNSPKSIIFFFARSFNDIDHMTPLVWYFSTRVNYEPIVFILDWNYEIEGNQNLQFLTRLGVQVSYFWDLKTNRASQRVILTALNLLKDVKKHIVHRRGVWRINRLRAMLERHLYSLLQVSEKFEIYQPVGCVFDLSNTQNPRNKSIVLEMKSRMIPSFVLPHSISIFKNKEITEKSVKPLSDRIFFDHYLWAGGHTDFVVDRGIPKARVVELGSMRFCAEWSEVLRKEVYPEVINLSPSRSKVRVAVFLSHPRFNVDNQALKRLIVALGDNQELAIAIKPHTRGMAHKYVEELVDGRDIAVCWSESSVALIRWADAIIVYASSIALDALTMGKVVIYPEFVDSNQTVLTQYNASWDFASVSELVSSVASLKDPSNIPPTLTSGAKNYLNKVVNAGVEGAPGVIERYFNFIDEKVGRVVAD
jgi:hypothetical protein